MTILSKIVMVACLYCMPVAVANAQLSIRLGSGDKQEIPVADIGEREAGKIYELTLVGQNLDCQKPQDFRFDVSSIDWLSIPGDDVVRDLAPGEQGSIPAEMNFTEMPPGDYEGQLDVICETCKFLVFTNCNVDKNSVILRVHLVEPQFDDIPVFPLPGTDQPVPGDYDGDGVEDPSVFRPGIGDPDQAPGTDTLPPGISDPETPGNNTYDERDLVYVDPGNSGVPEGGIFIPEGGGQDVPAPGDYDGDGVEDPGVFRPGTNEPDEDGFYGFPPGSGEATVPGDYDGNGITDPGTYHPGESGGGAVRAEDFVVPGAEEDTDFDNTPDADDDNDMAEDDEDYIVGGAGIGEHPGDGMQMDDDFNDAPVIEDYNGDGKDDIILPPRSESGTGTAPPPPTPGQVEQLTDAQRRNLENARSEASRTHDALEEACKKRDDCWVELARLRAARDQAKVAADAAAATAKTAADAATATQAHLDAYEADVAAANAAEDRALERVNAQNNAITALRAAGLEGTPAFASAQAELTAAVEAKNAAAVARRQVQDSLAARQAAARDAKAASETAATASANAASALATAQAALDAKERECTDLVIAKGQAVQAAAAAAATAAEAEANAPAQAAANLQNAIDAKKQALQNCLEELRHRAHVLEQMTKALKDIGVIGGTATTDRELDFEGDVTELIVTTAVDGVADLLNVATFQVFTILDSLKAAYGIIDILRLDLTPSRSGYDGDDNLDNWLENTKHYADSPQEAAEIRQAMTEFIDHGGNPASLKEKWERQVEKCRQLERELAALQAQQAALPK